MGQRDVVEGVGGGTVRMGRWVVDERGGLGVGDGFSVGVIGVVVVEGGGGGGGGEEDGGGWVVFGGWPRETEFLTGDVVDSVTGGLCR